MNNYITIKCWDPINKIEFLATAGSPGTIPLLYSGIDDDFGAPIHDLSIVSVIGDNYSAPYLVEWVAEKGMFTATKVNDDGKTFTKEASIPLFELTTGRRCPWKVAVVGNLFLWPL